MSDLTSLLRAEYITYPTALNLTRYLNNESSYYVWDSFSSGSSYIRIMLENTEYYENFKVWTS